MLPPPGQQNQPPAQQLQPQVQQSQQVEQPPQRNSDDHIVFMPSTSAQSASISGPSPSESRSSQTPSLTPM